MARERDQRWSALSRAGLDPLHTEDRPPEAFELTWRRDYRRRLLTLGAVLALWARMPGYRWLGRVFSLPPLRAVCEVLYDHIVAPGLAYWARVRQSGVRT